MLAVLRAALHALLAGHSAAPRAVPGEYSAVLRAVPAGSVPARCSACRPWGAVPGPVLGRPALSGCARVFVSRSG
ncbi:hypothetical protein ACTMTU_06970 [Streptomyces sp. OZ13]|uniref:hypothetical protein n=1 Tax=Streptomyces sp. OZ13 TaxID=3452210 RepID=UPI003F886865